MLRRISQASSLLILPRDQLEKVAETVSGGGGVEDSGLSLSMLSREQVLSLCRLRADAQADE